MKRNLETIFSAIGIACLLAAISWTYYQRDSCVAKGGVYIAAQWMCIKAETMV